MNVSPFILGISLAVLATVGAQTTNYTNFIRQKQLPSGVQWDMPVNSMGEDQSPMAINPGGAQFELWTVNGITSADYLLDSRYVGAYVPVATVAWDGGSAFTVHGAPLAEDATLAEVGLGARLSANSLLELSYSGQLADEARDHGVNARFSLTF